MGNYIQYLEEWLEPLGNIVSRRMFGGHCLYADGVVFAIVASNTLYLKADDETRHSFEARGLEPFRPFAEKPGTMQYYPPPPEFFEDPDVRQAWGKAAVEAGRRAQARKKPRQKRTAAERRGRSAAGGGG
jgi:DNA transformation protein